MRVREATDRDVDAICALLDAAFRRPGEAQLFRALREGEHLSLALVADGQISDAVDPTAGLGAISGRSRHDKPSKDVRSADERDDIQLHGVAVISHLVAPKGSVALGPLAVAGDCRDRGIGKALIGASVEHARLAGHDAIFVLGQPPWYTRFGFSVDAARSFSSEYPAEYMLALALKPGALDGEGALIYPPAFAAL